jgi:hypothetical protein
MYYPRACVLSWFDNREPAKLPTGVWRFWPCLQAMPTPEVLSTNVLHRFRIFAIVEQELRLPSGLQGVLGGMSA